MKSLQRCYETYYNIYIYYYTRKSQECRSIGELRRNPYRFNRGLRGKYVYEYIYTDTRTYVMYQQRIFIARVYAIYNRMRT